MIDEVLRLVREGQRNDAIAQRPFIALGTGKRPVEGRLPWRTTSSGTGDCPCNAAGADYRK